jgi:hypothetical protein
LTCFPSIFQSTYLPGLKNKCWNFRSNQSSVFKKFGTFFRKIFSAKNVPTECDEFLMEGAETSRLYLANHGRYLACE